MRSTLIRAYILVVFLSLGLSSIAVAQSGNDSTPVSAIDLKTVLEMIPRDVLKELNPKSKTFGQAVASVDAELNKFMNKLVVFEFKVDRVEPWVEKNTFNVGGQEKEIRVNGVSVPVSIGIALEPGQDDKATKLRRGARVSATGEFAALVYGKSGTIRLELYKAILK